MRAGSIPDFATAACRMGHGHALHGGRGTLATHSEHGRQEFVAPVLRQWVSKLVPSEGCFEYLVSFRAPFLDLQRGDLFPNVRKQKKLGNRRVYLTAIVMTTSSGRLTSRAAKPDGLPPRCEVICRIRSTAIPRDRWICWSYVYAAVMVVREEPRRLDGVRNGLSRPRLLA